MAHDDIDPLDAQDPRNHARQRLRSNLAAALLLDWLLTDVETQNPDYFSDLQSKFQTGFDYAAMWCDDPKFDGFVPVHGRRGSAIDFWIHQDDLGDLLSRLFPHGPNDSSSLSNGRALVAVMLHSAIETLFQDLDLKKQNPNEPIVLALARIFGIAEREPGLKDTLVDLHETRNLVAHTGRVTEKYRQRVPMTTFATGKTRVVTAKDIQSFSDAVHRIAEYALSLK